ncbi:MAG: putative binding protein precursor [bacterium ADurb.Bin243]|nr:MAG: putative binding protein precursor [bacterium ADurb.Bin243]
MLVGRFLFIALACISLIFPVFGYNYSLAEDGGGSLLIYAGAASKPPFEELAAAFSKKTGVKTDVIYGGSGVLLSQLKLSKKGDIYFPGSVDFIVKAGAEKLIIETSEAKIVYLVPALNVARGNPKKIYGLKDLLRKDVRAVIANPENVCLGVFGVELAEKNFSAGEKAEFKNKLLTYVESCEKVANAIVMGSADAVIGWSVFEHWNPEKIETVKLKTEEISRLSYLSVAVTTCAKEPALAQKFIDYMKSEEGMAFFKKFKYFTSEKEAQDYAGGNKPAGGECYKVPEMWMK